MNSNEYKNMTVQEFTKAADRYEGDKAGIYAMCKQFSSLSESAEFFQ